MSLPKKSLPKKCQFIDSGENGEYFQATYCDAAT